MVQVSGEFFICWLLYIREVEHAHRRSGFGVVHGLQDNFPGLAESARATPCPTVRSVRVACEVRRAPNTRPVIHPNPFPAASAESAIGRAGADPGSSPPAISIRPAGVGVVPWLILRRT
jgi:hypothetical protein